MNYRALHARNFGISILVLLVGVGLFYAGFKVGFIALIITISSILSVMYGLFWLADFEPDEEGTKIFGNASHGIVEGLKRKK